MQGLLGPCPLSFECDGERITQGFPGLGRRTVSWQVGDSGELMVEFQAKGQQALDPGRTGDSV